MWEAPNSYIDRSAPAGGNSPAKATSYMNGPSFGYIKMWHMQALGPSPPPAPQTAMVEKETSGPGAGA